MEEPPFPYVLRVSPGARAITCLEFIAVLILIGVVLSGHGGDRGGSAVGLAFLIALGLPFTIYGAACTLLSKVTITANSLEYQKLTNIRKVQRDNVIGFQFRTTTYFQYILLRTRTGGSLLIDLPFDTSLFFVGWLRSLRHIKSQKELDDLIALSQEEVQDLTLERPIKWVRNDEN